MSNSKTKKRKEYIVTNYDGGYFNTKEARKTWSQYRKMTRRISLYD